MNREIKFRAWNKRQNCWEEEGWAIQKHIPWSNSESHKTGMTAYWLKWIDDFDTIGYEPFWVFHNVARDLELSQYTGLRDKNGKEIYEGDIVSFFIESKIHENSRFEIKEVFWYNDEAGFFVGSKSKMIRPTEISSLIDDIEVIGNIYETPELLK